MPPSLIICYMDGGNYADPAAKLLHKIIRVRADYSDSKRPRWGLLLEKRFQKLGGPPEIQRSCGQSPGKH